MSAGAGAIVPTLQAEQPPRHHHAYRMSLHKTSTPHAPSTRTGHPQTMVRDRATAAPVAGANDSCRPRTLALEPAVERAALHFFTPSLFTELQHYRERLTNIDTHDTGPAAAALATGHAGSTAQAPNFLGAHSSARPAISARLFFPRHRSRQSSAPGWSLHHRLPLRLPVVRSEYHPRRRHRQRSLSLGRSIPM